MLNLIGAITVGYVIGNKKAQEKINSFVENAIKEFTKKDDAGDENEPIIQGQQDTKLE